MVKKVAIIGTGYWGRNLVRNFCSSLGCNMVICCDLNEQVLKKMKEQYNVAVTNNFNSVLTDEEVSAVVIATPSSTHFELAKKAIESGKHVLVEKPMAMNSEDSMTLIKLAEKVNKKLMVDHLLEYHPVVEEMKKRIQKGEIGDIYYLYGQRVNLGKVRSDENALWSFAPHDISVILYLLEEEPIYVSAHGGVYLQKDKDIEDVVFVNIFFPDGKKANIHLSWLDPLKIRRLTVVGSNKMMVFDDMEPTDKLKIFDKGVEEIDYGKLNVRYGDVIIPNIETIEPVKRMCEHFLNSIKNDTSPRTDGYDGLRVLKVLEAAQKSLKSGGNVVEIEK